MSAACCSVHPGTPLVVTSFCPRCRGSVSSAKKTRAARRNRKRPRRCTNCRRSGHYAKTCKEPSPGICATPGCGGWRMDLSMFCAACGN